MRLWMWKIMRPKELYNQIRLNHRFLLNRIRRQILVYQLKKPTKKTRRAIRQRLKAIEFIVTTNRVIKIADLTRQFEININN